MCEAPRPLINPTSVIAQRTRAVASFWKRNYTRAFHGLLGEHSGRMVWEGRTSSVYGRFFLENLMVTWSLLVW